MTPKQFKAAMKELNDIVFGTVLMLLGWGAILAALKYALEALQ